MMRCATAVVGLSLLCTAQSAGGLATPPVHVDATSAPLVPVDVIIESFCPCSASFEYMFATEIAPKLGAFIELRRWFDASARGSQHCCDPSTEGRKTTPLPIIPKNSSLVTCFHTKLECVANGLQRCVQAHHPAWRDWLAFSVCVNGNCTGKSDSDGCPDQAKVGSLEHLDAEKACAAQQGFDWTTIETCWHGDQSRKLAQADAAHDNDVKEFYGMQGLPVVHVGGQHLSVSKFWDCNSRSAEYQARLIGAICNATTASPKPPACAAAQ
jgi:hypothetical protein